MRSLHTLAFIGGLALAGTLPAHAQSSDDLFAVAQEQGQFSTLVAALQGSDATWFLEMDAPYTLFAPTDAAFDNLPAGVLEALMKPENRPKLNAIIERHVVPDAKVMAADLSAGQMIDPATGEPLEVALSGDQVMIGEATVVQADIATANGVVHAIDTVLVPELVIEAMKYREEWPEDGQ
jgi:uncharacterized surface protein with fasciclin (FAS1) repeats